MKHPYTIGLEYGWGDDALNVEGHHLLSRLSNMFHLSSKEREEMEMEFTESLPAISQGVGAGKTALKAYVRDLENWFPSQGERCAQYLGRVALDVGMTIWALNNRENIKEGNILLSNNPSNRALITNKLLIIPIYQNMSQPQVVVMNHIIGGVILHNLYIINRYD